MYVLQIVLYKPDQSFGLWIPYCTAHIFQRSICIPGTLLLMLFKFFFLPFHFTSAHLTKDSRHHIIYACIPVLFPLLHFVFHGRHSVSGDLLLLLSCFERLEGSDGWKRNGHQARCKMINRLLAGMLEHPAFFWHNVHFPFYWCFFFSDRSFQGALVLMKIRYWIY